MPEVHFVGQILRAADIPIPASLWGFVPLLGSTVTNVLSVRWTIVSTSADLWQPLEGGSVGGSSSNTGPDRSADGEGEKEVRLGGEPQGRTFSSSVVDASRSVKFDCPVDVRYECQGLSGWPMLVVQVFLGREGDPDGREDFIACGCARLPTAPGDHVVEITTWQPARSWTESLQMFFLGTPHCPLTVEEIISATAREQLTVQTCGVVHAEMHVQMYGFDSREVQVGRARRADDLPDM